MNLVFAISIMPFEYNITCSIQLSESCVDESEHVSGRLADAIMRMVKRRREMEG